MSSVFWKRVYRVLASVQLAVVLIALMIAIAAISTTVPQNREQVFYTNRYGGTAPVITALGIDHTFTSALFLAPVGVFTVNLLFCTIGRVRRELAGSLDQAIGPDIIHLGLILLIASGVLSMATRQERQVLLAAGDSVALAGRYTVSSVDFEMVAYESGEPKDWRTTLSIEKDDRVVRTAVVGVNRPVRVGMLLIYQYAQGREPFVTLSAVEEEVTLSTRDVLRSNLGELRFTDIRPDVARASVALVNGQGKRSTREVTVGSAVAGLVVGLVGVRPVSVVLVTYDPALALVLFSFTVIAVGLGITVARRVKAEKRSRR